MAFRSLQNGSFWCPKILMSSTKIWQSLLKPTVYYKMVPYDPIFTIEWQHYRGDNPSHSMEEMATGIHAVGNFVLIYLFFWLQADTSLRISLRPVPLERPKKNFIKAAPARSLDKISKTAVNPPPIWLEIMPSSAAASNRGKGQIHQIMPSFGQHLKYL